MRIFLVCFLNGFIQVVYFLLSKRNLGNFWNREIIFLKGNQENIFEIYLIQTLIRETSQM